MVYHRTLSTLVVLIALCAAALAQTPRAETDADKAKKQREENERMIELLDQAAGEAANLRLPQNRAIVYALSGDLFWKFDDKRARELFRNAGAEIVAHNQEVDKERRENPNPNVMFDFMDTRSDSRGEILRLIATRDAELALDLLVQTRPARLADAIARAVVPGRSTDPMDIFSDRIPVSQELALEQQFALLAADENPEKAIKLIKESLAKGVSSSVLLLLQKLNKKDEKKATELAGEVVKKLVESDLTKNFDEMQVAMNFLQYANKPPAPAGGKDKAFAFTEAQVKDLANKVASTLINAQRSMMMAGVFTAALPILEKLVPDKAALLRQKKGENEAGLPPEMKQSMEMQKLFDPNTTPEELLAQAPKISNEFQRSMAYQSLSSKIAQMDDDARAKKLIDQIPDEKVRANLLEQFESSRIARTAGAGKLEDARKLIGNLTNKKTQIQRLVALAMDFHRKGGEKDIENAKALMKDAKALTPEFAETLSDMSDTMEVVKGYTLVEPEAAFRMFDMIVERINEHMQAASTLARFNPQSVSFRKGELVLSMSGGRGESPLFQYIPHMQMLGKADLNRMNVATDRFARSDAKAIAKLFVLQGVLKDPKNAEAGVGSGAGFMVF